MSLPCKMREPFCCPLLSPWPPAAACPSSLSHGIGEGRGAQQARLHCGKIGESRRDGTLEPFLPSNAPVAVGFVGRAVSSPRSDALEVAPSQHFRAPSMNLALGGAFGPVCVRRTGRRRTGCCAPQNELSASGSPSPMKWERGSGGEGQKPCHYASFERY